MEEKILVQTDSKKLSNFAIVFASIGIIVTLCFGFALLDVVDLEIIAFIPAMVVVIVSIFLFLGIGDITITNKRVYKTTLFKTIIVLPLDKVCSYATGSCFKTVKVKTPSGTVSLMFVKKYKEIQETLDSLIIGSEVKAPEE
ncbi:MAG: hypothetical protein MR465_02895 [Bacilli bacterium]|nr:hypothetical protein [Bacilli bacterium]